MSLTGRLSLAIRVRMLDDELQAALPAYGERMGHRLGFVIKQQMRLLVGDLMKLTPPFRSRAARNESFAEQKRIGENAVARDIERVFGTIEDLRDHAVRLQPALRSALNKNDTAVLGKKNSLPELLVAERVLDTPDESKVIDDPTDALHNKFRRQRGRVDGRLPFRYWVKRRSHLKAYIKHAWLSVGTLKGGWGAAAVKFKASAPQWISRHFSGSVVDETARRENPFATAVNRVDYIGEQNLDLHIVENALKDRLQSMANQMQAVADKETL
jgi:hypothetical protein